ncbi:hypothetical protein HWV62_13785 [Athelia sp. TMB]|nr:hypothetical protein HWV62_13785 [Athelia sp. TMB]
MSMPNLSDDTLPPADPPAHAALAADRTTWAKRNPTEKTQPLRKPGRKLSQGEKLRLKVAAAERREREKKLAEDINAFLEERDVRFAQIAETHDIKVEKVEKLVNADTNYKLYRAPSIYNAYLHHLSEESKNLPDGERKTLSEIQDSIADVDWKAALSEERQQELIDELIAHRKMKHTGMRATNKSAQNDIIRTCEHISCELDDLAERTGYSAFFMGARVNVNDDAAPNFHGSGDAESFFPEVLDKSTWEISGLFEQWLCKRDKNLMERETIPKLRSECVAFIRTGLRNITNMKALEMEYARYDERIVGVYKVKLVGHPFGIKNPSDITTSPDLRTLRTALASGQCHWARLTNEEHGAHMRELEKQRAAAVEKDEPRRRKRKDAGVPRGPYKRTRENGDDMGPSPAKKRKTKGGSGNAGAVKEKRKGKGRSKSVIADSDSD